MIGCILHGSNIAPEYESEYCLTLPKSGQRYLGIDKQATSIK
jgi:hypothetical protein